jgi:hypothetical protein
VFRNHLKPNFKKSVWSLRYFVANVPPKKALAFTLCALGKFKEEK